MKKKNLLTASAALTTTNFGEGRTEKSNVVTGFDSSGQQSVMQQRK